MILFRSWVFAVGVASALKSTSDQKRGLSKCAMVILPQCFLLIRTVLVLRLSQLKKKLWHKCKKDCFMGRYDPWRQRVASCTPAQCQPVLGMLQGTRSSWALPGNPAPVLLMPGDSHRVWWWWLITGTTGRAGDKKKWGKSSDRKEMTALWQWDTCPGSQVRPECDPGIMTVSKLGPESQRWQKERRPCGLTYTLFWGFGLKSLDLYRKENKTTGIDNLSWVQSEISLN